MPWNRGWNYRDRHETLAEKDFSEFVKSIPIILTVFVSVGVVCFGLCNGIINLYKLLVYFFWLINLLR